MFRNALYAFAAGEHPINIRRLRVLQFLQECEAGHYDDSNGKQMCKPCPAGKYQPDKGKTRCFEVKEGYYQSESGQAEQIPCEKGTFSDRKGASECKRCSPHKFPVRGKVSPGATSEEDACYGECELGKIVDQSFNVSQTIADSQELGRNSLCVYCDGGMYWNHPFKRCQKCIDNKIHDYQNNGCKGCDNGQISIQKEGSSRCIDERICDCDNGVAKTGLECPRHGDLMCDTCDQYYHEVKIAVKENESSYKNDPEFSDNFYKCQVNECQCQHGEGVIGGGTEVKVSTFGSFDGKYARCEIHASTVCQSCNETAHYSVIKDKPV